MVFPRWLKLANLILAAGCLILAPRWDGVLAADLISAREFKDEVDRFKALGGVHSPTGFPELPPALTPFAKWRRAHTTRLRGNEVYVGLKKIRIWKTVFCGNTGYVFIELSLMDRQGRQVPFAWQECRTQCRNRGFCGPDNRLFLDLNGDGDAEMAFPQMSNLGELEKGFFKNTRFVFNVDIFPLWLKRSFGPDFKKLATIGPGDSVPAWKDHPLTLETQEEDM